MNLRLNSGVAQSSEIRRRIAKALALEAAGGSDLYAAEVIAGELLANVMRYAPGEFVVDLSWDEHGFAVLEIRDRGPAFSYPRPVPPAAQTGGRGLNIVGALSREMSVTHDANGNAIRVVLPVRRKVPG